MTDLTTRRTANAFRLLGTGVLFAAAGCFKLARPTPPLEEYVLGGVPKAAVAAPARAAGGITIGLRRLDLAPYLATTSIVVRHGSRIVTSGFRRWAEEPSAGVMREVAASLRTSPVVLAVDVAPWSVRTDHDYLVQLHVSHLEGVVADDGTATQGEVHLQASWEIIRGHDGSLVARGDTDRREGGWSVGDYTGLVSRADKGLAGLAGDLAACLVRLGPPAPRPDTTAAVPAAVRVIACAVR